MRKPLGSRIDWSMLTQGEVYRVKVPALGEVLARLIDKEKLEFEITEGKLQSQANKAKQWHVGQVFEVLPGMFEAWEIQ
jgi:hypothetical protein